MNVLYRNAEPQDLPAIIDLIQSARGDIRALDYQQFIVATCNNKIIGCVRTFESTRGCKELASLVITPEYRNKGVGSILVRKILERDISRPLYLVCFRNRMPFYEKNKFKKIDPSFVPEVLQRDYKRMTEEKGLDLVVMELR